MIRCEICKKTVFESDKHIVEYETIKKSTYKGFIPSYYLERDKEGIAYGLPKERKWHNIVKSFPGDDMELCDSCFSEMKEVIESKGAKHYYCFIATAAFESVYAPEVRTLRQYRDRVLMKSIGGRIFVETYYLLSPPLAKLISKSNRLKTITKKHFLLPIVRRIEKETQKA
jgi:hypothetical protein